MILDHNGRSVRLRRTIGYLPALVVELLEPEAADGGDVEAIGFRVDVDDHELDHGVTVGDD
jgi:hypothetical protein